MITKLATQSKVENQLKTRLQSDRYNDSSVETCTDRNGALNAVLTTFVTCYCPDACKKPVQCYHCAPVLLSNSKINVHISIP